MALHTPFHTPSSPLGKLKRLRLLDLSGSVKICINNGAFQGLEKLEELYLSDFKSYEGKRHPIRFTNANHKELNMLLRKLSNIRGRIC